jgi:hypothetical protein
MSKLKDAAKEYATKVQQIGVVREVNHKEASVSFETKQEIVFDDTAYESFIAGASWQDKQATGLIEALSYIASNSRTICVGAEEVLKKYIDSEGGG